MEHRKSEGPATTLTFLGIEIDTQNEILRLPTEKLQTLKATLQAWRGKKACNEEGLAILDWRAVPHMQSS